jgi:hypothetical protein
MNENTGENLPFPSTSPQMMKLFEALSKAQGEFKEVIKDKENPYFKSKYADLASVRNAIQPALTKHGLSVIQVIRGDELVTLLNHLAGGQIESAVPINVRGKSQELGSELTYKRRYALSALVGVAAEDDDDGNAASQAKPETKAAMPQPQSWKGKREALRPKPTEEQLKAADQAALAAIRSGISPKQQAMLFAVAAENHWTEMQVREFMQKRWGITSTKGLDNQKLNELIDAIKTPNGTGEMFDGQPPFEEDVPMDFEGAPQ